MVPNMKKIHPAIMDLRTGAHSYIPPFCWGRRGHNKHNIHVHYTWIHIGALAMESLHRQVLPFLLRRMKEDVLKDLPPKIIQDYYCDPSPLQVCWAIFTIHVIFLSSAGLFSSPSSTLPNCFKTNLWICRSVHSYNVKTGIWRWSLIKKLGCGDIWISGEKLLIIT